MSATEDQTATLQSGRGAVALGHKPLKVSSVTSISALMTWNEAELT